MARTDRALIGAAILFLFLTLGALSNFDALFSHRGDTRGEVIAEITHREGDVRVKFKNEFRWQKAQASEGLAFDDSVFSGADSHVQMKVGPSELNLDPNTLIVLRKDDLFRTLKMNYGSLQGLLAKNDKIYVESDGERLELSSRAQAKVTITKSNGQMVIRVKSGAAKVITRGKTREITPEKPLIVEAPKRRPHALAWTAPNRSTYYTDAASVRVDFGWRYTGHDAIDAQDVFTLEIARDAKFKEILAQLTAVGENHVTQEIARGPTVFARVTNPYGEKTLAKAINVRPVTAPVMIAPLAESDLETAAPNRPYPLNVKVSGVPVGGRVWSQVSRGADFKDLVYNQTATVEEVLASVAPGEYFLRARNLYDDQITQSAWSPTTHIHVHAPVDLEHLTQNPLATRVFIANANYPARLYGADDAEVQNFVRTMEPLPHFFRGLKDLGLVVVVARPREGEPDVELTSSEFPAEWIYPGDVDLAYRLEARAQTPARVAYQNVHRVQFVLEAPNQLRAELNAAASAQLSWSPILFARGYEVQLRAPAGRTATFTSRKATAPVVLGTAGATYAFRVRALGRANLPITAWSELNTFQTPAPVRVPPPPPPVAPPPVEIPIAATAPPPPPAARAPAQSSVAHLDEDSSSFLHRLGAWVWAGVGFNIIDVHQTVASTADIDYFNHNGPSTSLEAGFVDLGGVGLIFHYARLPGVMHIDNVPLDKTNFVWDQYSVDGVARLAWRPHLLRRTFTVAFTGGAQYQQFPFLYVSNNQTVSQGRNSLLNASAGLRAESNGRLRYHLNLRYEQPLLARSEGGNQFDVSPIFAFDGSVGASYFLNKAWQTGVFWFGQFQDYKFNYTANSMANTGSQSLFYSAMELRLGYEF